MFAFCHWGSVHAQDLGFECLLISKCDTELLNKVCDSLHPAWVAARRGCIITTNLVRICSLVLAGREQRVEFNISVFLSWGLPQLSNLSPSFRPACDGSWIIPSLKLRTKNPLKNQQIFFYFFFFSVFVGIKNYFISCFHCLYTNGWKQCLVCDFTGGKFICVCMYQQCLSILEMQYPPFKS